MLINVDKHATPHPSLVAGTVRRTRRTRRHYTRFNVWLRSELSRTFGCGASCSLHKRSTESTAKWEIITKFIWTLLLYCGIPKDFDRASPRLFPEHRGIFRLPLVSEGMRAAAWLNKLRFRAQIPQAIEKRKRPRNPRPADNLETEWWHHRPGAVTIEWLACDTPTHGDISYGALPP